MSTEASIQKGKGLIANPEFFLTFGLTLVMGIAATFVTLLSWLNYDENQTSHNLELAGPRFWAIGLVAVVAALFAVAWFSGLGEKLFVGIVALMGVLAGILSCIVVVILWWMPTDAGGHGSPLYAILLALTIIALPIASIAGEKILPLFVAILAAIWGVLSVIIFVMVVFIGVE